MIYLIFFLQFNPLKWLPNQPLERVPAILSLFYLGGMAALVAILLLMVVFSRRRKSTLAAESDANLPDEVRKRLGSTAANRALWVFRFVFAALAFCVFGFHIYWAMYAAQKDKHFAKLEQRDIRNRRVARSELRGWILDRTGELDKAIASWKIDKKNENGKQSEKLVRQYSMDKEMSHLLGTEIGSPGLERTLFKRTADSTPEALQVAFAPFKPKDAPRDVKLSIDSDLQKYIFELLQGWTKGGSAAVVLNPQTGDVLAVVSNPTFSLSETQDKAVLHKLEADERYKPLVSRAMRTYYAPGSSFKTFTMYSAFRNGKENATFVPTPGGFVPGKGLRAIPDAGKGGCEHCGQTIDLPFAYEFSSNQFFSWMALQLGAGGMRETADLMGIKALNDTSEVRNLSLELQEDIWNVSNDDIRAALGLSPSAIVTSKFKQGNKTGETAFTQFDLAIQGMGQGLAAQQTPFQMAMIASVAGNTNGNLMKPKIEADRQPEVYNNILTPQVAKRIREEIMPRVIYGGNGTAKGVASIIGDVRAGGKTGTAQGGFFPIYDKNGNPVTYIETRRNRKTGEITKKTKVKKYMRWDGWFVSVAPVSNPQVAIAVVCENIGDHGFGGSTAAPIVAKIIVKARELGLLGEGYTRRPAPPANNPRQQPRRR